MSNYVTPTIGTGAVSGALDESLNIPELYLYDTFRIIIRHSVVPSHRFAVR